MLAKIKPAAVCMVLSGLNGKESESESCPETSVLTMAHGLEFHLPSDVFVTKVSSKYVWQSIKKSEMVSAASLTLKYCLVHVHYFLCKQCFQLQSCICILTEMFVYLGLVTCVAQKVFPNLHLNILGPKAECSIAGVLPMNL